MKISKQVLGRTIRLGGEEHSGWLTADAVAAVDELIFDIRIIEAEGGFILAWHSRTTDDANDLWHETIRGAIEYAERELGINADEWEDGDEEFEGDS